MKRTVLIVDDDPAIRDSLSTLTSTLGLSAETFSSAADFLEYAQLETLPEPACLIVDVRMPQMSGIELLDRLSGMEMRLPTIMITGHGDADLKFNAEELGCTAFLEKPFRPARLTEVLKSALDMGDAPNEAV